MAKHKRTAYLITLLALILILTSAAYADPNCPTVIGHGGCGFGNVYYFPLAVS